MKLKKSGPQKSKFLADLRTALQAGMMGLVLSAAVSVISVKMGSGYAAAFGALCTFLASFLRPKAKKDHSISFTDIPDLPGEPKVNEKEESTVEITRPNLLAGFQIKTSTSGDVTTEIEASEPVLVSKPAVAEPSLALSPLPTPPPSLPPTNPSFPNSNSAVMFLSAKVPKTVVSNLPAETQAKTLIPLPEFEFPKSEEEQTVELTAPTLPPAPIVKEVRTGSPGLHNSPMAKKSVPVSSIGIEIPEAVDEMKTTPPIQVAPPAMAPPAMAPPAMAPPAMAPPAMAPPAMAPPAMAPPAMAPPAMAPPAMAPPAMAPPAMAPPAMAPPAMAPPAMVPPAITPSFTEPPTAKLAAPLLSSVVTKWKIYNGAKIIGPFTAKEIAERLYAQELDFDCLCWPFDETQSLPDPALDSASVLSIQKAGVFGRQDEEGSVFWVYNRETINGPVSQAYVRTALICGEIAADSLVCKESTITGWISVQDWYKSLKTGQVESGSPKRVA